MVYKSWHSPQASHTSCPDKRSLTLKWYEDDRLYANSTRYIQAPQGQAVAGALKGIPVRAHQIYTQPGDAKVEVYWNGQLVTSLHFVVEGKV